MVGGPRRGAGRRHASSTPGATPRAAVGPDLNQLFVGSEGTLGIIAGPACGCTACARPRARAGRRLRLVRRRPGRLRRMLRRGATPAVLRLYDPVEANRSYQTGDRPCCSCSTRASPRGRRQRRIVDEECAGGRSRSMWAWSSAGWATATTCPRSRSSSRRGWWSTPWRSPGRGRRCPRSTSDAAPRIAACPARWPRRPTRATPTPRAPACTSPSPASPTAARREAYYRAVVGRGHPAVLAAGGALSHHHGVGINRARFMPKRWAPARRAGGRQGRARPQRHPQPGQARPPQPVRTRPLAVTSASKASSSSTWARAACGPAWCARTPRSSSTARTSRAAARLPRRGPGRVRREGARRRVPWSWPRRRWPTPGRSRASGISTQRASTIVWDRASGEPVGPALGWQDLRTIGECLVLPGRRPALRPQPVRHEAAWLLDTYDTGSRPATCASARPTHGSPGRSRRVRARDRRDQRRRSPAWSTTGT